MTEGGRGGATARCEGDRKGRPYGDTAKRADGDIAATASGDGSKFRRLSARSDAGEQ